MGKLATFNHLCIIVSRLIFVSMAKFLIAICIQLWISTNICFSVGVYISYVKTSFCHKCFLVKPYFKKKFNITSNESVEYAK